MTPKEKAKELIEEFAEVNDALCNYQNQLNSSQVPFASEKRFTLRVVDEIIYEISHGLRIDWIKIRQSGEETIEYWSKVLNEINNYAI